MRASLKRTPQCFALEGRELLNAAWSGQAKWTEKDVADKPPAMVHHVAPGAKGDHGNVKGTSGDDFGQRATPSAQAKADMQTLQSDMQTLQSEIPASITAAVTADRATITSALSTLTPAERHSLLPAQMSSPSSTTSTPNPSAMLTPLLTAANVSPTDVTTIENDFAAYQNALTTTDPTLQAKITADKAALAKDMPGAPARVLDPPAGGILGIGGGGGPGFGHGPGLGMT